ncbi:unnamed protein product [Amoebophrya sp. A120]|nr:unnamed protein product [Amoebophrya sp. A120]|eukprot:GSA120T00022494001.1
MSSVFPLENNAASARVAPGVERDNEIIVNDVCLMFRGDDVDDDDHPGSELHDRKKNSELRRGSRPTLGGGSIAGGAVVLLGCSLSNLVQPGYGYTATILKHKEHRKMKHSGAPIAGRPGNIATERRRHDAGAGAASSNVLLQLFTKKQRKKEKAGCAPPESATPLPNLPIVAGGDASVQEAELHTSGGGDGETMGGASSDERRADKAAAQGEATSEAPEPVAPSEAISEATSSSTPAPPTAASTTTTTTTTTEVNLCNFPVGQTCDCQLVLNREGAEPEADGHYNPLVEVGLKKDFDSVAPASGSATCYSQPGVTVKGSGSNDIKPGAFTILNNVCKQLCEETNYCEFYSVGEDSSLLEDEFPCKLFTGCDKPVNSPSLWSYYYNPQATSSYGEQICRIPGEPKNRRRTRNHDETRRATHRNDEEGGLNHGFQESAKAQQAKSKRISKPREVLDYFSCDVFVRYSLRSSPLLRCCQLICIFRPQCKNKF